MNATSIKDIDHLQQWIGRQHEVHQRIDIFPARALAALLNRDCVPEIGDALPLPWHWLYFLETPLRASTGIDGHPKRGNFLPPVPLPRRMWASGEIEVETPLKIGFDACKRSTVKSIKAKQGQSGLLIFVTLEHELSQNDCICLRELQHIVYREAAVNAETRPSGRVSQHVAQWRSALAPDPALLFRYSALTYNGHRIHYDRNYAVQQEHYPALVIQGPLLATLLLDLLQREQPLALIAHFDFRALQPAFDIDTLTLNGCVNDDGIGASLWTTDADGMQGMIANARIA